MLLCATPARAQSEEAARTNPPQDRPSRLAVMLRTQAILSSADGLTTVYNLRLDGHAREANPFLAPFSRHPTALAAIHGGVNALQMYTISRLHRRHPRIAEAWALIVLGAEAYAVSNNVMVARQLRARARTR